MYQSGESLRKIAHAFGYSRDRIAMILTKRGIKIRSRCPVSRYSDDDRNRMAEMYRSGYTQKAIAEQFGCSLSLAHDFLRQGRKETTLVPPKDANKTQEIPANLVRDFWQAGNRAVEMMLLPQDARTAILEHVSDALRYACVTLRKGGGEAAVRQ
jgi:transposase-like protein